MSERVTEHVVLTGRDEVLPTHSVQFSNVSNEICIEIFTYIHDVNVLDALTCLLHLTQLTHSLIFLLSLLLAGNLFLHVLFRSFAQSFIWFGKTP